METVHCALCDVSDREKPLLAAQFEGRDLRFCPSCLPSLIHGLTAPEVRQVLREKAGKV